MSNYILQSLADEVYENLVSEAHRTGKNSDWVETNFFWNTGDLYDMLDFLGYTSISEYVREACEDDDAEVIREAVHQIYTSEFWLDKITLGTNTN